MKIETTALASPAQALTRATRDHEQALGAVQQAFTAPLAARDEVHLSDEALAAVDAPTSTEQAVADSIVTKTAVQAASESVRAEDDRRAALIFLLAHHGRPLG